MSLNGVCSYSFSPIGYQSRLFVIRPISRLACLATVLWRKNLGLATKLQFIPWVSGAITVVQFSSRAVTREMSCVVSEMEIIGCQSAALWPTSSHRKRYHTFENGWAAPAVHVPNFKVTRPFKGIHWFDFFFLILILASETWLHDGTAKLWYYTLAVLRYSRSLQFFLPVSGSRSSAAVCLYFS